MKSGRIFTNMLHRGQKRRVLKKRAVAYGINDSRQMVINRASRPDSKMPNLGIARLYIRQTNSQRRGLNCGKREIFFKKTKSRLFCRGNRVALYFFRYSETVKNY